MQPSHWGDMPSLPSGTVTFVFSDVERSTQLLKELGDGYGELLDEHRRLMRLHFGALGGVEIDTQGDAFFFAFPRARDAVTAAVEAQRAHAAHEWPGGVDVRVRMGLHTGEPAVGSEGYTGLDVVRAARLCTSGRRRPRPPLRHHARARRLRPPRGGLRLPARRAPPEGHRRAGARLRAGDRGRRDPPSRRLLPRRPSRSPRDDFGARLAAQIEASVRRSVEASLERAVSQVDALAERAARRPDAIAERLEEDA